MMDKMPLSTVYFFWHFAPFHLTFFPAKTEFHFCKACSLVWMNECLLFRQALKTRFFFFSSSVRLSAQKISSTFDAFCRSGRNSGGSCWRKSVAEGASERSGSGKNSADDAHGPQDWPTLCVVKFGNSEFYSRSAWSTWLLELSEQQAIKNVGPCR